MLKAEAAPNELDCGCRLGPVYEDCSEARRLKDRIRETYRQMPEDRGDREGPGRHDMAKRALRDHYRANGVGRCAPWGRKSEKS